MLKNLIFEYLDEAKSEQQLKNPGCVFCYYRINPNGSKLCPKSYTDEVKKCGIRKRKKL